MIDPDLVPGDRLVIHPATAILFHLADRHPEARLVPQPGTALRGLCYRRMFDMAEELQVAFVALFKATRLSTDPQCAPAIKARAGQLLQKRWGYIDNALGSGPYLLGKDYSICDIYMYVLARWSEIDHEPLTAFVNVRNTCARIEARLAVRAALTTDGIRLISRD
jgi:glutathione S-transferase